MGIDVFDLFPVYRVSGWAPRYNLPLAAAEWKTKTSSRRLSLALSLGSYYYYYYRGRYNNVMYSTPINGRACRYFSPPETFGDR